MRARPLLLDLYCGAGGAAMGYHRAGFDIVGVDIRRQPNYPFPFVQGDAIHPPVDLARFDAIHASPPCQRYSAITPTKIRDQHPDLYEPTRDLLVANGRPWVIENVMGSPYRQGAVLCGSMFGKRFRRHRMFEASFAMLTPSCDHRGQGPVVGVYGHGGRVDWTKSDASRGQMAPTKAFGPLMDMDWAHWREVAQAVPPVYTEFVGAFLMDALEVPA